MKLFLKSALVLLMGLLLHSSSAQAQVRVNVNVPAPYWGPAVGPDVEYYYIPEIDGYYDLYAQRYIYFENGYWVSSPVLPRYYSNYNPRYFHPIVINYLGRQPWGYIYDHRAYSGRMGVVPGRYYAGGRGYSARAIPAYHDGRRYGNYGRNDRRYDNRRNDDRRYDNDRGNARYDNDRNDRRYDSNRNDDQRGGYARNEQRPTENRRPEARPTDNRGAGNQPAGGRGNSGTNNGGRGGRGRF